MTNLRSSRLALLATLSLATACGTGEPASVDASDQSARHDTGASASTATPGAPGGQGAGTGTTSTASKGPVPLEGGGAAAAGAAPLVQGTAEVPGHEADPFPTNPEAVVVTVDGTEITAGEVGSEARRMISLQTGGRMPPEQLAAFEPSVRPAALQGMIDAVLLDEAAAEAGIEVSPEDLRVELERNLDAFLLDSGMSREDLDQRVQASEGMTLEQMLTEQSQDPEPLRRMGHAELVRKRFPEETEVTDEEVAAAYEEQKETAFSKPATVRASHVLVDDRARAEELAELARTADVAFADLARENSTCPSAEQGGDLGFFKREGQMVEPFAAAAFELEPGEISDVVETQHGFHVIQVTERKPATVVSLEEAAPMLRTQLELRRIQEQLDPLLADLRSGAEIDYAEGLQPEQPAAPASGAGAEHAAGDDHAGHDH